MQWPAGAKYCVHLFHLRPDGTPVEDEPRFADTLLVPDAPFPTFRLRRSRVAHWWQYMDGEPRGWWWAKAHDCTFDCEDKWAGVGWRATA